MSDNIQTDDQQNSSETDDVSVTSSGYERAPQNFESGIDTSDAKVPDHPVVVDVEGHGQASARLVKQKTLDEYLDEDEENAAANFGYDELAEIIKDHYVSPKFRGLTGDDIANGKLGYYDPFFEAIVPDAAEEQGNE